MIRLVVGVGVRGKWRRRSIFLRAMERHGMGYRVGSDEASSKPLPSFSGGHAIPKKMLSLYLKIPNRSYGPAQGMPADYGTRTSCLSAAKHRVSWQVLIDLQCTITTAGM